MPTSKEPEPFILEAEQTLPYPLERVFGFFARPENLEAITPPWLGFRIITPAPVRMEVGAVIDYRLSVRGIPLRWRSLIEDFQPPVRFVDTQVTGPYRLWHHTHSFERIPADPSGPERTIVRDRVRYLLPRIAAGPLASVLNATLVRPDLDRIFAYRARRIAELLRARPRVAA